MAHKLLKKAHYGLGAVNTPSAAEARVLQSEHELFDALEQGLRCAMLAAGKLGYVRQEGRWFLVRQQLEKMIDMAKKLGRDRQRPPLLDVNGMRMN
jgi:hypothetical protein